MQIKKQTNKQKDVEITSYENGLTERKQSLKHTSPFTIYYVKVCRKFYNERVNAGKSA